MASAAGDFSHISNCASLNLTILLESLKGGKKRKKKKEKERKRMKKRKREKSSKINKTQINKI